jgi:Predicted nucleotide-utilizing enzyme related to molybdopterin-biosynthesis enzyme MoeA
VELNLLEKTEVRIYGLALSTVNLGEVAAAAAEVLALPPDKVLVVDVRADHICLDLLVKTIDMRRIAGKEKALLEALKAVDGLEVTADAHVDSAGIMGLIGSDETTAAEVVARTETLAADIEQAVLKRALVFATGFEVANQMIEDTNSPYLMDLLAAQGYQPQFGGILADDVNLIARQMLDAAERGFGLIITTGGVGAEDKDFSVEALLRVDGEAATPWIVKFRVGTGRHVKEGVRIGVGQCGLATLISLPGPHDEVVAAGQVLTSHCRARRIDKAALAADIAAILRDKLRDKLGHKHWHHERKEG